MDTIKRILIVDDDEDICNLMLFYLKSTQYQAFAVGSAEDALERLSKESYDLIISDIIMPGMNGIEFIRHASDLFPNVKILACSEGGTSDAREIVAAIVLTKAVDFGAIQALMKPFSKREFLEMVESAL